MFEAVKLSCRTAFCSAMFDAKQVSSTINRGPRMTRYAGGFFYSLVLLHWTHMRKQGLCVISVSVHLYISRYIYSSRAFPNALLSGASPPNSNYTKNI